MPHQSIPKTAISASGTIFNARFLTRLLSSDIWGYVFQPYLLSSPSLPKKRVSGSKHTLILSITKNHWLNTIKVAGGLDQLWVSLWIKGCTTQVPQMTQDQLCSVTSEPHRNNEGRNSKWQRHCLSVAKRCTVPFLKLHRQGLSFLPETCSNSIRHALETITHFWIKF